MNNYQDKNINDILIPAKSNFDDDQGDDIRKYFIILRQNLVPSILIFTTCLLVTFIYLASAEKIYKAETVLKIDPPRGNILREGMLGIEEFGKGSGYIPNQIAIIKSYYLRESVADKLLDTIPFLTEFDVINFRMLINPDSLPKLISPSHEVLTRRLLSVNVEQSGTLEAISINHESPSFDEARIITNIYADQYIQFSQIFNRKDLTIIKEYLAGEKDNKYRDLNYSEASLEEFYNKTGKVFLEKEATLIIDAVSSQDAELSQYKIEQNANKRVLSELNSELAKIDPQLKDYIDAQLNQPYFQELQSQTAILEVKRDIELSTIVDPVVVERIRKDYDLKIESIETERKRREDLFISGIYSETPQERKVLVEKILQSRLNDLSINSKINTLGNIIKQYEFQLSNLPRDVIELARLQRQKQANEKLYLVLEEKYQEAVINERSTLSNAYILDPGIERSGPIKPNVNNILFFGIVIGLVIGIGFALGRNYFDRSIKNPEDLEKRGVPILAWIPSVDTLKGKTGGSSDELIVLNKASSSESESFKALRTRVQYAKLEEKPLKSILVTSSIPGEGKTFVSSNLAGTFAINGKKVVIIDCDLRKPRLHNLFNEDRFPGVSDYLFSNVELNEIIRDTKSDNLKMITAGTIPPNPSELLGSVQMKNFLNKMEEMYDMVIIDSPPIVSVTDSEILFSITDGTILVAKASKTPIDLVVKTSRNLSSINSHNYLGCVLNDFNIKGSYGYYYNYYYYYSTPEKKA